MSRKKSDNYISMDKFFEDELNAIHYHTKEEIINFVESHCLNRRRYVIKAKVSEDIKRSILYHTPLCISDNITERIYWIYNNLIDYPVLKCPHCDTIINTKFIGLVLGYNNKSFCSVRCATSSSITQEKMNSTMKERYGEDFNAVRYNKIKNTMMERYGSITNLTLEENIKQSKITKLEKYGDENFNNLEKRKLTNLDLYGTEHGLSNDDIRQKSKETKFEKYGDEYYTNPNKGNQTKVERYGDTSYNNIEKRIQTNISRFGVEHGLSNDVIRQKSKQTKLERYGNEYYTNRQKAKSTILERYGVEHQSQVTAIFEKQQKFRWKEYILPSGKIIKIQGYENKALDILLKFYSEDEIINDRALIPKFWYTLNDKTHKYYPDFYIPKDNMIIEIKSTFTLTYEQEKNDAKFESVKNSQYSLRVMVFDTNKIVTDEIFI